MGSMLVEDSSGRIKSGRKIMMCGRLGERAGKELSVLDGHWNELGLGYGQPRISGACEPV